MVGMIQCLTALNARSNKKTNPASKPITKINKLKNMRCKG